MRACLTCATLDQVSWETTFVFALIGIASILFASGRVRLDIVALLVVLALALSGVLTVREALAGFGDPGVILVAGLLVLGEALTRTGVAYSIGQWVTRVGGDGETRLKWHSPVVVQWQMQLVEA